MGHLRRHYSDDQVQRLAASSLSFFGTSNTSKVDLLACLRRGEMMTARGLKRLVYEVCDDDHMGADDAKFDPRSDAIIIKVKASVHSQAAADHGRARFTLAHELGHAVLHVGFVRARVTGAGKSQNVGARDPFEREADLFAATFLINDEVAESLGDAGAIANHFGVSLEAARYHFKSIEERRRRADSTQRVLQKAAAFRAQVVEDPVLAATFLDERCTCCGERKLTRTGVKA